jgi:hypothetical protein
LQNTLGARFASWERGYFEGDQAAELETRFFFESFSISRSEILIFLQGDELAENSSKVSTGRQGVAKYPAKGVLLAVFEGIHWKSVTPFYRCSYGVFFKREGQDEFRTYLVENYSEAERLTSLLEELCAA